jgi:hypothetical protein
MLSSSILKVFDETTFKRVHPGTLAFGGLIAGTVLGYSLCLKRVYSIRPSDE